MAISARAPGKVVLLGEYAVLDGAEALVMAVRRHVRAWIEPAEDGASELEVRAPDPQTVQIAAGAATGLALIDTVIRASAPLPWPAWRGVLDSTGLFAGGQKLGLGSSAAALTAFAGAWWGAASAAGRPPVERLIDWHREFQGGTGSGLDVAAARLGGVLRYRLDTAARPRIGSVQLPNSVGFAGIFAGSSASTADFVALYREWGRAKPESARDFDVAMREIAARGCAAATGSDGQEFVAAMAAYGDRLDRLGYAMGVDLVTREHRHIGRLAGELGVTYKVSGAGGGDLGVAASTDADALHAFVAAAAADGFLTIELEIDHDGLVVEEQV